MQKDVPYVGFQSVDFGVNSDISEVKMDFILVNVSLDKVILFFIAVSLLASGVIVKLKYLKVPNCFFSFVFAGMSDCFVMTMHSVSFAFS